MMEQASEPRETPGATPEAAVRPATAEPQEEQGPRRRLSRRHATWATLLTVVMIGVLMTLTGQLDLLARDFMRLFEPAPSPEPMETLPEAPAVEEGTYSFEQLDIHPDLLFQPYTAGQLLGTDVSSGMEQRVQEFRDLLALYEERQGTDDNFTIRVVDNRTDEVLEIYSLEAERARYQEREKGETWNWGRIDGLRRIQTRRLVDKYVARGVPQPAITIKWGRANQVHEAREREEAYIEYEIRLARYLGLSLLATEIGTVETFNQDRLVSSVGARSRYQMMPYVLRQNDIRHYSLPTAAGNAISVYEEWHPLLTMEASLRTAAGYVNAVGHEIPGISAYHTGPGNIYTVFRLFLSEGLYSPTASVMDAYVWAVTDGYPTVSRNSSFKTYSRGYIASAYGSLRAMQDEPIDSSKTLRAERVQVADGQHIYLTELLDALGPRGRQLDWGPDTQGMSLYNRFRKINPHFGLPRLEEDVLIPSNANVRLSAEAGGAPVRFFLPLGASALLDAAGVDVLDDGATFRYDRDTFGTPQPSEVTIWDRQYEDLVADIEHFGFTRENRKRLFFLEDRFEALAEANPTHFRQTQLEVIRTHKNIWQYGIWEKLAEAVESARGETRMQTRPLAPLQSPRSVSALRPTE